MELSYQRENIKIQICRCYTWGEADNTITLLKHPKIDFLVAFRRFSYTNRSWKLGCKSVKQVVNVTFPPTLSWPLCYFVPTTLDFITN
jgi:hypothetical protein